MKTLYNITQEYAELVSQLMDNEGEMTEEMEMQLSINQDELQRKAEGYALVIKEHDYFMNSIDEEMKRLKEMKDRYKKIQERLKDTIAKAMILYGYEKIETPFVRLSFRKSTSVKVDDPDHIEKKFCKEVVTVKPDLMAIKKALQNGELVLGAELVENQNLQIK